MSDEGPDNTKNRHVPAWKRRWWNKLKKENHPWAEKFEAHRAAYRKKNRAAAAKAKRYAEALKNMSEPKDEAPEEAEPKKIWNIFE